MNITEQANKYAEGKANEAITKAIADAYMEGYKAGYKDREEEIPMELRDNKTEYVDLGLPSGTLWATDYERLDGNIQYLTYEKAKTMKLPTKEQWGELYSVCKWHTVFQSSHSYAVECVGPNGNVLKFVWTGLMKFTSKDKYDRAYFWIEDSREDNDKYMVRLRNDKGFSLGDLINGFSGYKLPIRLVR